MTPRDVVLTVATKALEAINRRLLTFYIYLLKRT